MRNAPTVTLTPLAWMRESERAKRAAHIAERLGDSQDARRWLRNSRHCEERARFAEGSA